MTRTYSFSTLIAVQVVALMILVQLVMCSLMGQALPDGGGFLMSFALGALLGISVMVWLTRKVAGGATADSLRKTVTEMVIGVKIKAPRRRRAAANDNRRRKAVKRRIAA